MFSFIVMSCLFYLKRKIKYTAEIKYKLLSIIVHLVPICDH